MKGVIFLEFFISAVCLSVLVNSADPELHIYPDNQNPITTPVEVPFGLLCEGTADYGEFTEMKWFNSEGEEIRDNVRRMGSMKKLTFPSPSVEDSGDYKCAAIYNNTVTMEAEVSVDFYADKPTFVVNYSNLSAEEGSSIKMTCQASGETPITYEWHDQRENRIYDGANWFVAIRDNLSELVITNVLRRLEGIYTCLARNLHGSSSKIFQLTVLPPGNDNSTNVSSSILNVAVVDVTSNSVKFAFQFVGPVENIGVSYFEKNNHSEEYIEWKYGDIYEVKNLIAAGMYSFKFQTFPSEDNGAWSELYTVVLLPDVPEVIYQKLQGNSVRLQWFRAFDDLVRETIDSFELTYFTVRMEGGNIWVPSKCNVTIQIASCQGSSYTISGLSSSFYYQIELRAHTASGFGKPSKQKIYTAP